MYKYLIINLKSSMPTVEECLNKLKWDIISLKSKKHIIKIIHGFGSTGKGGKLRIAIRKELFILKKKNIVKFIILGEHFSIFNPETRLLLDICSDLKKDSDLNLSNNGITLISFK